jgi:hypothetical protein
MLAAEAVDAAWHCWPKRRAQPVVFGTLPMGGHPYMTAPAERPNYTTGAVTAPTTPDWIDRNTPSQQHMWNHPP